MKNLLFLLVCPSVLFAADSEIRIDTSSTPARIESTAVGKVKDNYSTSALTFGIDLGISKPLERPYSPGSCVAAWVGYEMTETYGIIISAAKYSNEFDKNDYAGRNGNQILTGESNIWSTEAYFTFRTTKISHIQPTGQVGIGYFGVTQTAYEYYSYGNGSYSSRLVDSGFTGGAYGICLRIDLFSEMLSIVPMYQLLLLDTIPEQVFGIMFRARLFRWKL